MIKEQITDYENDNFCTKTNLKKQCVIIKHILYEHRKKSMEEYSYLWGMKLGDRNGRVGRNFNFKFYIFLYCLTFLIRNTFFKKK